MDFAPDFSRGLFVAFSREISTNGGQYYVRLINYDFHVDWTPPLYPLPLRVSPEPFGHGLRPNGDAARTPVACCRETLLQHWSHRSRGTRGPLWGLGAGRLSADDCGVEFFRNDK